MRTEWTFRSESVRLTTPDGLAQAGIDVALGPRADLPITAWESMFIPMRLRDYLREVTVPGVDGATVPLVQARNACSSRRTPRRRARRASRTHDRRVGTDPRCVDADAGAVERHLPAPHARGRSRDVRSVVRLTGILGLLLLGMWVGSAHVFWYDNLNLLLLSPLGVVAAVSVTRAILRGRTRASRAAS